MRMISAVASALAMASIASSGTAQDADRAAVLDTGGAAAVEASNRFAADLYRREATTGGNLFLSPASISTALGLAYRGARGATAQELRAVLHFPAAPDAYLSQSASLLRSLDLGAGNGRELLASNALWVQQGLSLDPAFVADVAQHAGAGLQQVDYRRDPEAARATINGWVAARTRDRIKDLLQPTDVTDQTRVTLVNAVYWKGKWASPFAAETTRTEPFTGLNGRATPLSLMHQQANFRVAEAAGIKAIELPYMGGEIAMVVLLPNDPKALPRFEAGLDALALTRWVGRLDAAQPRETVLTLPKLHLEWRDDLVPVLTALGATRPFGAAADFTGMAGVTGERGTLTIGKVIHQTFLDVDEEGSEAAAATAVITIVMTGARVRPTKPFIFRADTPFVFLLRDRRTGLILFMGRYVGPTVP